MPLSPSFFLFLSCSLLLRLSCASHRRILHQPFFPLDTLPPSQPPSPSPPAPQNPKLPFSSSATTPNASPFFPAFPAPPPPPPANTFASFPANISSLILPSSPTPKSTSHKLLIVALSAVLSAALVAGALLFLYCRRRRKQNPDSDIKTSTSESSNRLHSISTNSNGNNSNAQARKLGAGSTPSSDFLYLGTLVNSRGIDESSNSRANTRLDPRKMDSPELQPLPPLSRQATAARNVGEVGSVTEEDEEAFYSPRGSLSGTGSGSRRVFAAIKAQELDVRSSCSSTCSCSSSSSGSPARSHSISISPPISRSPRKSPQEFGVSSSESPLLSLASTSPEYRGFIKKPTEQNLRSPSLSPIAATSPARNLLNQNVQSPSRSTSPDAFSKCNNDVCPNPIQTLNESPIHLDRNMLSPSLSSASTSPDATSPKISILPSPSPEISASASPDCNRLSQLSSPAKECNTSNDESPRISNVPDEDFLINSTSLEKPISAPVPPPPPPPPPRPLQSQRSLENSVKSGASVHEMPKPPPLIPPSRPFMVQNPVNVSPIELPPSSESVDQVEDTPKPKLKPLHWDKVRASSDREMVWDHLRSSSFK